MKEDPIKELVEHEVGKLYTAHLLKAGQNVKLERIYKMSLDDTKEKLKHLRNRYVGKTYRKEIHRYARELYKDGRRKIWHFTLFSSTEGRAMLDVSAAIINAFKQLKK